jgi:diacylglycerol kinase (ATP)
MFPVKTIAVIAKRDKTFGGGLEELRGRLADAGYPDPIWLEISKSRQATKKARQAIKRGADLILVWGGDGTVQRTVDAVAGSGVRLGVMPAGTANLFATNLGIPKDVEGALAVALGGHERKIDVGVLNGERFAVMAGVGFDAFMIRGAAGASKERLGRVAYIRSGLRAIKKNRVQARVTVDGTTWFNGKASCVLIGNVGTVLGGLQVFQNATPDDGLLEVGVVTAKGMWQWLRVFSRVATRHAERSPLVKTTHGHEVEIRVKRPTPYELDGGARPAARRFKIRIEPAAIAVGAPVAPVS